VLENEKDPELKTESETNVKGEKGQRYEKKHKDKEKRK
jgi:hypothetical protein